ncbi:hypothetical protein PR048_012987 [Dryococelus australis]|uniref:Uncharacterized protein n=1 Tax=Dryococelus australis TaxID=614101 RepID=A0ABQ9HR70_9NEOP|nr:hypothetical protein PR048_012987 [Dryococelus australis]
MKLQLRLRVGIDHTSWAEYLSVTLFCVRNSDNEDTGQPLATLLFGCNLAHPGEFHCLCRESNTRLTDPEVRKRRKQHTNSAHKI